jgi:hypothetical protein
MHQSSRPTYPHASLTSPTMLTSILMCCTHFIPILILSYHTGTLHSRDAALRDPDATRLYHSSESSSMCHTQRCPTPILCHPHSGAHSLHVHIVVSIPTSPSPLCLLRHFVSITVLCVPASNSRIDPAMQHLLLNSFRRALCACRPLWGTQSDALSLSSLCICIDALHALMPYANSWSLTQHGRSTSVSLNPFIRPLDSIITPHV